MQTEEVSKKVAAMYDAVSHTAYGENYFPVVKSLGLSPEEFKVFAAGKKALEVGSGGGQLSVFLSGYFDQVTGIDISAKSLEIAAKEARARGIPNLSFEQGNLFDDDFLKKYAGVFDFVLCYGVLHHTADPAEGYKRLATLLKSGGYLVTGVYSRTQLAYRIKRQIVIWLSGSDQKKKEATANKLFFKNKGPLVHLYDAYVHPQVSFHSISEVYSGAAKAGLNFIGSWPNIELSWYFGKLTRKPAGKFGKWNYNKLMFLIVESLWILSGKSVMVSMAARK